MQKIKDQPTPEKNKSTPVWDLVIKDMQERDKLGRERYGTPLQAGNGRDALVDAYEEELDKTVYLKQFLMEREEETKILCQVYSIVSGKRPPGKEDIAKSAGLIKQILKKRHV